MCKTISICFTVYAPDMPKRLPIQDIVSGLLKSIGRAVRYWFHYTLVAVAWLGVVPLTACKFSIFRIFCQGAIYNIYAKWNIQILLLTGQQELGKLLQYHIRQ